MHRSKPKRSKEDKERRARIQRGGLGVNVKAVKDKKLKGRLKYSEKLFKESQDKAAKISEWLLPSDSGILEAEGGLCMH
jgi:U3 small nucleolar RNA-associated protein 7